MPLDLWDLNFKSMTHPELILSLGNVADCMSVHPLLKDNWPWFVISPQQLKVQVDEFKESLHAASGGDRGKIAERNAKREVVEQAGVMIGTYVAMRYAFEKNPAILENTGLRQKSKTTSKGSSARSSVVGVPGNLTIKDGAGSGWVMLSWSKDAAAVNYEVQFCVGDPAGDESWNSLGHHKYCRSVEFKGFQPGQRCNFRVRCQGEAGPGPWSLPISFIIR